MNKWYKRISCLLLASLLVFGVLASADELSADELESAAQSEETQDTQTDEEIDTAQAESIAQESATESDGDSADSGDSDTDDSDTDDSDDPEPEPEPEKFAFTSSTNSVKVNKTVTLTLRCNVEDTVTGVTSSNPSVAAISYFDDTTVKVDGKKKGSTTITATTENGMTATCTVTVTQAKQTNGTDKKDKNTDSKKTNTNGGSSGSNTGSSTGSSTGSGGTAGISSSSSLLSGLTTTTTATYTIPDNIPSSVALTFSCSLGKYTDTILENMDTYNTYGTFFVPSKDIYRKDDRVRRIVGQGNAIGITLTKEQVSDTHKALRAVKQANTRLSTVCGIPTRLVTVEGGSEQLSEEVYTALTDAGYRIWDSTYTVAASDVKTDTEKLESAMDTKKRVVVRMDTSKHSAEIVKEVLGYMSFASIPTKALADSDRPVCQAAGK